MTGRGVEEVRVVASPYLICPLGAHIDHQGGTVSAMTINKGIVLGFIPSGDSQVVLRSGQFKGEVRFSIDEVQHPRHDVNLINKSEANGSLKPVEECSWGNYARGALYALQRKGNTLFQVVLRSGQFKGEVRFSIDEVQHPRHDVNLINKSEANGSLKPVEECSWGNYARGALYALQRKGNTLFQGITGYICGSEGLDSSGLSSSAAVGEKLETCQGTIVKNFIFFVGVAYLLAFETANNLTVSPVENIEYDRLIENDYLGLRNGILDQSAILLSSYGCLLIMNCKTLEHKLVHPPELRKAYKILLAFSGLKHALTQNPGYNCRVSECREAARILLSASGMGKEDAVLSDVEPREYQEHKSKLEPNLAKRAEHYFTETLRVNKGIEAWASGNLEDFGMLITASGLSSIQNYECGSEPLILLYKILVKTPGIFGVRFSGAGFRGCCIALVDANFADEAASSVRREYQKLQPELAYQLNHDTAVLICDTGDCARVI